MFKAHIVVIFANLWLFPLESVLVFETKADCYESMRKQLKALPEELIESGFGVQSMDCIWTPKPPKRKPSQ
jgi:hypothetical protein